MSAKFTPISELGEFKLINRVTKNLRINNNLTKRGIGDDAAVINSLNKKDCLISTDMLVEGVHFDSTYTPLKHLGYKSIIVNISDICAMNGKANQALVSLGIPNKYSVEHIEELYSGIRMACEKHHIDLVGGDTTSSSTGLIISITIIGECDPQDLVYRSGSKPNDLVFVSGDLGAAYLGLQILEREKQVFNNNQHFKPKLEEYKYILQRQLKPEARVDIIRAFKTKKIQPSSMIDLSDGLSSDIMHICRSSGVGVKIFENKIPISKQTKQTAKELGLDPVICALHGGEDYELLFTIPVNLHSKLKLINNIYPIGHTTSEKEKVELITNSGESIDLTTDGWDNFIKK